MISEIILVSFLPFKRIIRFPFNPLFTSILIFCSIFPALGSQTGQNWHLSKQSVTTAVYYRNIDKRDLIEVKAQVVVSSSLSGFLLFMQDTDQTNQWLDNAQESKIIKKLTPTSSILKTTFSGFWPVSARMMLVKNTYWQNEDLSVEVNTVNAKKEQFERYDGEYDGTEALILIDVISAHWTLIPITPKKLIVNYQFIVDAKGSIPHWIVNKMALKSTWKTLENLRKALPISRWQASSLSNISELTKKN